MADNNKAVSEELVEKAARVVRKLMHEENPCSIGAECGCCLEMAKDYARAATEAIAPCLRQEGHLAGMEEALRTVGNLILTDVQRIELIKARISALSPPEPKP